MKRIRNRKRIGRRSVNVIVEDNRPNPILLVRVGDKLPKQKELVELMAKSLTEYLQGSYIVLVLEEHNYDDVSFSVLNGCGRPYQSEDLKDIVKTAVSITYQDFDETAPENLHKFNTQKVNEEWAEGLRAFHSTK